MAGFQLCNVVSLHLEKIVNKLDYKSYFRLQQTCRDVQQFIHDSQNISVPMEGNFELKYDWNPLLNSNEICCYSTERWCHETSSISKIKLDGIYGIRFNYLLFCDETLDFQQLHDYLENNHITCHSLEITISLLTKEQCVSLLKLVRPTSICMNSKGSDRFEAIYQSDTLNSVTIYHLPDPATDNTSRLLSTFTHLDLTAEQVENPFDSVKQMLELLFSQSVPNLRKLLYTVNKSVNLNANGLLELLDGFNIPMEISSCVHWTKASVELSNGYFCIIAYYDDHMDVYYEKGHFGGESPYSNSTSRSATPSTIDDVYAADMTSEEDFW